MVLEASISAFRARLDEFFDGLAALRVTVTEDKPASGDVVLVEKLANAADDLLGWVDESRDAARACQHAVERDQPADRARRALSRCQERLDRTALRLASDLLAYDSIGALMHVGRVRGPEWRLWVGAVKESLDQCQRRAFESQQSLGLCWQELVQRLDSTATGASRRGTSRQKSAPRRSPPGATRNGPDDTAVESRR